MYLQMALLVTRGDNYLSFLVINKPQYMPRVKSQARLDSEQNGSRRRQATNVAYKSQSCKSKNIIKKRRRDGKSPEKD